jgi:hypothetical protein
MNMMGVALWHGITWNFALFGAAHSVFVSTDALTAKSRKSFFKRHPSWSRPAEWVGRIFTFHLVALGLVAWRARSVADAAWVLLHMWTPLTAIVSGVVNFVEEIGWRGLPVGLAAWVVWQLAARCWESIPAGWELHVAPRWIRWSFYSVAAAMLTVGVLLMFVNESAREPFLYEVF